MAVPIVLCCDLRFASDRAVFTLAFSKRGLVAEWGSAWLLPRLVGPSNALDLLFSSRTVAADEALRIGLVNRVVPRDELDDATMALADESAKNEPFVVRSMKASINRVWELAGLRAALDANTELDVMIETANLPARDEFRRITQEEGLKAAIAWRDARYRSGE
jgi:enoyl-CoA hydratase/carnithine racemase